MDVMTETGSGATTVDITGPGRRLSQEPGRGES